MEDISDYEMQHFCELSNNEELWILGRQPCPNNCGWMALPDGKGTVTSENFRFPDDPASQFHLVFGPKEDNADLQRAGEQYLTKMLFARPDQAIRVHILTGILDNPPPGDFNPALN